MLLITWVESRRCRLTFVPNAWRMPSVVASKACRPRSWASKRARKLCSVRTLLVLVFCARWASSGVSSRACCHSRLNSNCSSASASVRANISLSRRTPKTVATGWLGRPLSSQYKGANCSSSISAKGVRAKGLGPGRLLALPLGRRHQVAALEQVALRILLTKHQPHPLERKCDGLVYTNIPRIPDYQGCEGGVFTRESIIMRILLIVLALPLAAPLGAQTRTYNVEDYLPLAVGNSWTYEHEYWDERRQCRWNEGSRTDLLHNGVHHLHLEDRGHQRGRRTTFSRTCRTTGRPRFRAISLPGKSSAGTATT